MRSSFASRPSRSFQIEAGKTVEFEIPVYFSEKKYLLWKKKHPNAGTGEDGRPSDVGTYKHAPKLRIL